jgi:hypothetical protein
MTFEEFFKKKKIDLDQLAIAEPVLFAELKDHYAQMGEKSFDHTKKYWFNQLRRTYHTPEEVKVEKLKIENQLAEQTITESITETVETPPAPKVGFTPRFKAGATKPAEQSVESEATKEENPAPTEETAKPTVGFKPRFKAGVTKPAEQTAEPEATKEETPVTTEEAPKPTVGFKPRFKAGVTKPAEAPVNPEPAPETKSDESTAVEEAPKPAVGFKPRFKPGVTKPQKEE